MLFLSMVAECFSNCFQLHKHASCGDSDSPDSSATIVPINLTVNIHPDPTFFVLIQQWIQLHHLFYCYAISNDIFDGLSFAVFPFSRAAERVCQSHNWQQKVPMPYTRRLPGSSVTCNKWSLFSGQQVFFWFDTCSDDVYVGYSQE